MLALHITTEHKHAGEKMRHIIAYIKLHKLSSVTLALHKIEGLTGMTVLDVKGFGRTHRIVEDLVDYVHHVRIEIFCLENVVERIVSTIQHEAHTGLKGDGKIYICGLQEAIRISSGERGESAV